MENETSITLGWVIAEEANVLIQPLLSVAVTAYTPTSRLLISLVVAPLDHKKLYGEFPPLIVSTIEPLFELKQVRLVFTIAIVTAEGSVMENVALLEQLLLSVTVTE